MAIVLLSQGSSGRDGEGVACCPTVGGTSLACCDGADAEAPPSVAPSAEATGAPTASPSASPPAVAVIDGGAQQDGLSLYRVGPFFVENSIDAAEAACALVPGGSARPCTILQCRHP